MELFGAIIGPTKISVDCFFGLGLQGSDIEYMPFLFKIPIFLSEHLRKLSSYFPFLIRIADSVYVEAEKNI